IRSILLLLQEKERHRVPQRVLQSRSCLYIYLFSYNDKEVFTTFLFMAALRHPRPDEPAPGLILQRTTGRKYVRPAVTGLVSPGYGGRSAKLSVSMLLNSCTRKNQECCMKK